MMHLSVVALSGGVGGAKLAHGLCQALEPETLTLIVNTGDDFDHYGLRICPDLDTALYTLAEIANEATGWGVADETWTALDMLRRYGVDAWFQLGDRDFATHILRTERLRAGATLTDVIAELAIALGVRAAILPMADEPVPTIVRTQAGELAFQDYFVRRRHEDDALGVRYQGAESAQPTAQARIALAQAETILLCPSNPFVSIGPILAVAGMRDLVRSANAARIAVSPIIGGKALKGPADRMLATMGHEVSSYGVAAWYGDLLDGMVIDAQDAAQAPRIEALGIRTLVTNIVMASREDRVRLARDVLQFAAHLRSTSSPT
jgi:LPPG:FO 2-phospho-L-lactate transferase